MKHLAIALLAALSLSEAHAQSYPGPVPAFNGIVIGPLNNGPSTSAAISVSMNWTTATPLYNGFAVNPIIVTDTAALAEGANGVVLYVQDLLNATGYNGLRTAADFVVSQTHLGSGTTSHGYTALLASVYSNTGDGGGLGTEKGGYLAGSLTCVLDAGAAHANVCVGQENDIQVHQSATYKYGYGYSSVAMNMAAASQWDAAYEIGAGVGPFGGGTLQKWSYGILATDIHTSLPFRASATFMGALFPTLGTQTMTTGIDMQTNLAFTGNAFQSSGFSVNGIGAIFSNSAIVSNGKVTAFASTAIPAGGTAGTGFLLSSTTNFGIFFGSGAPTLSAAKGSLYLRSDGAINNRLYINTDGSTTWTAFATTS